MVVVSIMMMMKLWSFGTTGEDGDCGGNGDDEIMCEEWNHGDIGKYGVWVDIGMVQMR